jgi:AAA domain/UvrD-like helicase C-terminal domain
MDLQQQTETETETKTKTNLYQHLNSEQYAIVHQPPTQNLRILAAAGSGKTTTLTVRIAHLIQSGIAEPHQIILLTFTRNAAGVMRTRLQSLIGNRRILCGTFHSLSQQLLREHDPTALQDLFHVDELPLKALDWMEGPRGQAWIAANIRWLFIDEYQDINDIQERFIKALLLLKQPSATVTIVGDDAQNIYAWRGSCVDYILNFHQRFNDVADFQLSTNYRSTTAIVAVANSVMRRIPTLPHKQLMSAAPNAVTGSQPEVRFFSRTAEERDWVAESAVSALATGTVAILSKFNSVLFAYEALFMKAGVRCRFVDAASAESPHPTIYLSTFHGAKGLEWDTVYLVRMNDEVFPQQKDDDSVLQERRLFYVAVTRAKRSLSFTYSRNERSLCRFIREIHRPLLMWRSLPRYELSALNSAPQPTTVSQWISYLTGEDFRTLKAIRCLPAALADPSRFIVAPASPASPSSLSTGASQTQYAVPYWWAEQGLSAEFSDFLRAFWHREISVRRPDSGGCWDRIAQRVIWTIKIAAEDAAIFTQYSVLIENLARRFFGDTPRGAAPPQINWTDIVAAMGPSYASIQQADLIRIIQIIHKMRTMLYNLRFVSVALSDLTFAPVRHAPPQESRCPLIEAWRVYTNGYDMARPEPTTDELLAVYQIGLCRSLSDGRSGVVAQLPGEREWVRCREFLRIFRQRAASLVTGTPPLTQLLCRVQAEVVPGVTAEADMLIGETAWFLIAGDQVSELQRLDTLVVHLLTVHALRLAGYTITAVTLFQPLSKTEITWSVADWSTQQAELLASFIEARIRHSMA